MRLHFEISPNTADSRLWCIFLLTGVERHFCKNISIKPKENNEPAKVEVNWIRTTTIETGNVYRFGATNKIVVLAGRMSHTVKSQRERILQILVQLPIIASLINIYVTFYFTKYYCFGGPSYIVGCFTAPALL